jgi:hypothetical protein
MSGENRDDRGSGTDDPADAVADTLRTLGAHLDGASVRGAVTPALETCPDIAFGAGVLDEAQEALLGSLGVDAVIDTNAKVSQRSLREFLR